MENNINTSKKIILNYGLILSFIIIIVHAIIYASGRLLELNWLNSAVGILGTLVIIILALHKYKQLNNGYLGFGDALKTGLGISMICAIITIAYTLLFMNVIDPNIQVEAMEAQREAMIDQGMSDEQIESSIEIAKRFQSPFIIAAISFVFYAFIGFVFSAIAGAVMKKEKDPFSNINSIGS